MSFVKSALILITYYPLIQAVLSLVVATQFAQLAMLIGKNFKILEIALTVKITLFIQRERASLIREDPQIKHDVYSRLKIIH